MATDLSVDEKNRFPALNNSLGTALQSACLRTVRDKDQCGQA